MRKTVTLLLLSVLATGAFATKIDSYFNKADVFFKKYVKNGKVNYAEVKQHMSEVESLLSDASMMTLAAAPNNRNKAFFINAYNLIVIRSLARPYPVYSTKALPGFFDKKKYQVGKTYYTLDELEYYCLRRPYKDNRIHFALIKGAKGSPTIPNYAFKPEKIEQQLDMRTMITVNNAEFIKVNSDSKTVLISELFKRHEADFNKGDETILSFINKYRKKDKQIPTDYKLDYYPFDWKLNKQ
jgi:hypothetical protein